MLTNLYFNVPRAINHKSVQLVHKQNNTFYLSVFIPEKLYLTGMIHKIRPELLVMLTCKYCGEATF